MNNVTIYDPLWPEHVIAEVKAIHSNFNVPLSAIPQKKRRAYRCKDRMCGALDCANCFPNTYDDPSSEREVDESETDEE